MHQKEQQHFISNIYLISGLLQPFQCYNVVTGSVSLLHQQFDVHSGFDEFALAFAVQFIDT